MRVEQLRLLVLKTAWLMDTHGNKAAHTEIQAIKIATPQTVQWSLDTAIQVHGAGGLSEDYQRRARDQWTQPPWLGIHDMPSGHSQKSWSELASSSR